MPISASPSTSAVPQPKYHSRRRVLYLINLNKTDQHGPLHDARLFRKLLSIPRVPMGHGSTIGFHWVQPVRNSLQPRLVSVEEIRTPPFGQIYLELDNTVLPLS